MHLKRFRVTLIRDGKKVFTRADRDRRALVPDADRPLRDHGQDQEPDLGAAELPWAAGLEPVPPGVNNPLGTRWIGTSAPDIGFHATPMESTVGTAASHGCMRMHREDVERLYELVRIGTPVDIEV